MDAKLLQNARPCSLGTTISYEGCHRLHELSKGDPDTLRSGHLALLGRRDQVVHPRHLEGHQRITVRVEKSA